MDSDGLVASLEKDFVEILGSIDRLQEDNGLVVLKLPEETVECLDFIILWNFAIELLQTMKSKLFLVVDENLLRLS